MSIHEKIKRGREAMGWSMEELASRVSKEEGLTKPLAWQTVQQWENGTTAPKRKRLEVVAKLLQIGVSELLGDTPATAPSMESGEFVQVWRADVKFSNGHGVVIYHEDGRPPLSFRSDFLRKLGISEGHAVVVDATGNSNEPKIVDGAVVLVDRGDRDRLNGEFFAFRADGELLIKRLERLEGVGVVATAENSDFRPKMRVYREGVDDFEVIGRARWMGALL